MRDHRWIGAERPWSVGIEEEALLLDPTDWSLANRIEEVLSAFGPQAAAETHACVVELRTAPHPTAGGAARARCACWRIASRRSPSTSTWG
jgi:hypothetical protein